MNSLGWHGWCHVTIYNLSLSSYLSLYLSLSLSLSFCWSGIVSQGSLTGELTQPATGSGYNLLFANPSKLLSMICKSYYPTTSLLLLHYYSTLLLLPFYPTLLTTPLSIQSYCQLFSTPSKVVVNYLSSEWPFSSQLIQITISHLKTPSMKRNSPRLSLFNHHSNHLCFKSSQFRDLVFSLPIYTAETTAAANKIDLKTWRFSLRATVFMLWERWTNFTISNNYFFCKFKMKMYYMLLICVHIIRHM